MEILNFFSAIEKQPEKREFTGTSLTRSGMALTVSQLYNVVMTGRTSTAIVDQPGTNRYDPDDDSFAPDERELATIHEFVTTSEKKRKKNVVKATTEIIDNQKEENND